ncbi:cuticle protein 7-like [Artemia franciscana]|uniref:Cuticle protein n=1 Tax=Artemia franciscana TaxID=6661 RepID=A0AA88HW16_ARTSF|nr:hypothetical protein QYM36_010657 [Artemia franciscana]
MKTLAILFIVVAATMAHPSTYGYVALHPFSFPYVSQYSPYSYAGYPNIVPATAPAVVKSVATPYTVSLAPAYYAPSYTANQYHSQDELGQASYGYAHPGQSHAATRDAYGNVVGSYAYVNPDGKEIRVNYVADNNGFRVSSNDLPVAPAVPAYEQPAAPLPVEDTPEVKAAKAEHFNAVAAVKARNLALE